MQCILALILNFLLLFLFPSLATGEMMDVLVGRGSLVYKKIIDFPFMGKTTGKRQGAFENGKREGPWFSNNSGKVRKMKDYRTSQRFLRPPCPTISAPLPAALFWSMDNSCNNLGGQVDEDLVGLFSSWLTLCRSKLYCCPSCTSDM